MTMPWGSTYVESPAREWLMVRAREIAYRHGHGMGIVRWV